MKTTAIAWLWLLVRIYVGWAWLTAGWAKVTSSSWVGEEAGAALSGFVQGALQKTGGAHPDVQSWYAAFLESAVLPYAEVWSYLVAFGELLVGLALILGFLVGLAAAFGAFMNMSFLLAGAVSTNPILLVLSFFLICAWRTAGLIGADRFLLPKLIKIRHEQS